MKLFRTQTAMVPSGLAASLILFYAPLHSQQPATKEGEKGKGRGFGGFIKSTDPRVQNRT